MEACVLPAEARVPPKPSGLEAHAFLAEARVPPKPSGPALPSSSPADMVPHHKMPATLENLSTGTLLSYARCLASLPSKDQSLWLLVQLVSCHPPLTAASSSDLDPRNIVKEEPASPFDALVSTGGVYPHSSRYSRVVCACGYMFVLSFLHTLLLLHVSPLKFSCMHPRHVFLSEQSPYCFP